MIGKKGNGSRTVRDFSHPVFSPTPRSLQRATSDMGLSGLLFLFRSKCVGLQQPAAGFPVAGLVSLFCKSLFYKREFLKSCVEEYDRCLTILIILNRFSI
jgi:hypothetical protein